MTSIWLAAVVGLAGGVGAALRHLVDRLVSQSMSTAPAFPWGLLTVNLSGSFVLGLLTGLALGQPSLAIIATGLLGGYTTFSSASLDTAKLLITRRYTAALTNGLGVLVAAVACAVGGMMLGAQLLAM